MTRARIDRRQLEAHVRREMEIRARGALRSYRRQRLKRDAPGYPFAQRPEDGSIRDPRNQSITRIPRGVRIKVESRGAPFIERGNDQGGPFIDAPPGGLLSIPLKARRRRSLRVFVDDGGKAYLHVNRVRSYRGRRLLEKAVRGAFGVPGIVR